MNKKQLFYVILMSLAILSFISITISTVIGIIFMLIGFAGIICTAIYKSNSNFWNNVSDSKSSGSLVSVLPDVKYISSNLSIRRSLVLLVAGCLLISGLHITIVRDAAIEFCEIYR